MVQFESNHPCIHTVYNSEKWTSLVFTSFFLKGCISGCRSPNEIMVWIFVMIYFMNVSFFLFTLYLHLWFGIINSDEILYHPAIAVENTGCPKSSAHPRCCMPLKLYRLRSSKSHNCFDTKLYPCQCPLLLNTQVFKLCCKTQNRWSVIWSVNVI